MRTLPEWATQMWQCVCGVWVPPAYVGVCPCGEIHPDLAKEMDES